LTTKTSECWDNDAAAQAVRFFERYLTHVKGKWAAGEDGKPMPLRLDEWQRRDIVEPLFGAKRADGTRRYRTCYVEVPRKNGKTTLAAGVALYMLFVDREPGAEIYSAAADRDQAAICFDIARQMVEASPALRDRVKIYRRSIVNKKSGATYKVLSADAHTKHGFNASCIVFDELHAQPNRDLWDVLTTSTGARRQPLVFAITTAGHDQQSICWEIHEHACKVRDGIIVDPSFLPVIYAADKDDDWTVEPTWAKANPGFGVSVYPDYFRQEVAKARESPSSQNTFRRLHLNVWTSTEVLWLQMDKWNACGGRRDDLDGKSCYAGLDLAKTGDLTALSLVFPHEDGTFDVLPTFWIPEDSARIKARRDRVPYLEWSQQGHIELTPGNVTDYAWIEKRIDELAKRYSMREIAYDPWNASQTAQSLAGKGYALKEFRQGFASMNEPTKKLEELIIAGKIRHGGHPVLAWNAGNVSVKNDAAGNLKPVKPDYMSGKRIDGIVATIMALGLHIGAEPEPFFAVDIL